MSQKAARRNAAGSAGKAAQFKEAQRRSDGGDRVVCICGERHLPRQLSARSWPCFNCSAHAPIDLSEDAGLAHPPASSPVIGSASRHTKATHRLRLSRVALPTCDRNLRSTNAPLRSRIPPYIGHGDRPQLCGKRTSAGFAPRLAHYWRSRLDSPRSFKQRGDVKARTYPAVARRSLPGSSVGPPRVRTCVPRTFSNWAIDRGIRPRRPNRAYRRR